MSAACPPPVVAEELSVDDAAVPTVRWGATIDDVRRSHHLPARKDLVVNGNGVLVYDSALAGEKATLTYRFLGARLYSVSYHIDAVDRRCAALSTTFDRIVEGLKKSLGDSTVGGNTGTSVCDRTARWSSPDSDVVLHLGGTPLRADLEVSLSTR